MNRTIATALCLIASGLAAPGLQAPSAPTADVATHEQLVEKLREAPDPTTTLAPAKPADPAKIWKPGDLLARSDFFCLFGQATLVPKGAILHVPAQYAERLKLQEGAKILTWADFYAVNRGWIQTLEVTRKQAEGDEPFPEETVKALAKSPSVVVATLRGGPISVLPPKQPVDEPGKATLPGRPLDPGQAAPVLPRPVAPEAPVAAQPSSVAQLPASPATTQVKK